MNLCGLSGGCAAFAFHKERILGKNVLCCLLGVSVFSCDPNVFLNICCLV